ncbi:hypothetical protein [Streptomyces sp. NBC_01264]|uniref:hypothetical protein n=1 Tax=Streptomyces sp. NBC_01264 TaxID=2903804 RepID=UPI002252891E|nr:hypothetical protein [Streptomyces sp. NBC_01264]MCX4781651.1 hypothetical protein [Streptomyces sp. NBC_01264]
MTPTAKLGLPILALAISAAASAGPLAYAGQAPHSEAFTLIATKTGETLIDSGQPTGIGNVFIGTSSFARGHDSDYGTGSALCTNVSAEGAKLCSGTYELPDGQITWQRGQPPVDAPPTGFDAAITGGTGKYSTARGYIHVIVPSREGPTEETVYLQH